MREAAPKVRQVTLLWDSTTGDHQLAAAKVAAHGLRMEVRTLQVRSSDELERLLAAGAKGMGGLIQMSSPLFELHVGQIAEFTLKHGLPAVSISTRFTDAGGLISYGPIRPGF